MFENKNFNNLFTELESNNSLCTQQGEYMLNDIEKKVNLGLTCELAWPCLESVIFLSHTRQEAQSGHEVVSGNVLQLPK